MLLDIHCYFVYMLKTTIPNMNSTLKERRNTQKKKTTEPQNKRSGCEAKVCLWSRTTIIIITNIWASTSRLKSTSG